jgi:2-methylcitrate dehydratase PrpD
VRLHLRDGRTLEREQHDYEGFHTRPMDRDAVRSKFDRLAARHVEPAPHGQIADAVRHLDELQVDELTRLLTIRLTSD